MEQIGTDPLQVGYTVLSLLAILQLANIIFNIWSRMRRNPPIDQSLQDYARRTELCDYARRTELDAIRRDTQRHEKILSEVFSDIKNNARETNARLNSLANALSEWQNGIERQIGKLENHLTKDH